MVIKDKRTVVLAAVVLFVASVAAVSAASWEINPTSPTVDTPTETVTMEGEDYQVSGFIRVDQGESIDAKVQAPSDKEYETTLRRANQQRNIVDFVSTQEGSGTVSFTEKYEPGSYTIVVNPNKGKIADIYPVIVSGYHLKNLNVPDEAGGSFEATVDISPAASSGDPYQVKIVVGDGDNSASAVASKSGGSYQATVDTSSLPKGDYLVYAVAQKDKVVRGKNVAVGVSDSQDIKILENDEAATVQKEEEEKKENETQENETEENTTEEENLNETQQDQNVTESNETQTNVDEDANETGTETGTESEGGEEMDSNSSGSESKTQPEKAEAGANTSNVEGVNGSYTGETSSSSNNSSSSSEDQGSAQPFEAIYVLVLAGLVIAVGYRTRS